MVHRRHLSPFSKFDLIENTLTLTLEMFVLSSVDSANTKVVILYCFLISCERISIDILDYSLFSNGASFKSITHFDNSSVFAFFLCEKNWQKKKFFLSLDDQFTSSSTTLLSSPRTPGKKLTKGDPIVTGIRLRPFLERFVNRTANQTNNQWNFSRESAIDNTSAVQIFENNVICTQNGRPQIFKFTNCFDAAATNVRKRKHLFLTKIFCFV